MAAGASTNRASTQQQQQPQDNNEYILRWSSTGGGWRAMCACMGFANLFQQAGLFFNDHNDRTSLFSAVATTSGASWFSTQFFYAPEFYQQTAMAESPQALQDFLIQWMTSYAQLLQDMPTGCDIDAMLLTNTSSLLGDRPDNDDPNGISFLIELFDLLQLYSGNWASFVDQMIQRASQDYNGGGSGGEGTTTTTTLPLTEIVANGENRIPSLRNTDLLIQTALAPSARLRMGSAMSQTATSDTNDDNANEWGFLSDLFFGSEPQDMAVFFGPMTSGNAATIQTDKPQQPQSSESTRDDWEIYSVPLSVAYVVNETFSGFQYGAFDYPSGTDTSSSSSSNSQVVTFAAATSTEFEFDDWESFFLYEADPAAAMTNTSATIPASAVGNLLLNPTNVTSTAPDGIGNMIMAPTGIMPSPFGGGPAKVNQLAAITSAAGGLVSPAIPSAFAQGLSKQRSVVAGDDPLANFFFDQAADRLYQSSGSIRVDDVAVCGQWPNPCGPADGYFIDGGFADNPAVVINVAQYHQQEDADLTTPMKLVLTNTNEVFNVTNVLSSFLQYFETDFNRGIEPGGYIWPPGNFLPTRSHQIFKEFLDREGLLDLVEPIEESSMTTAILRGTTLDNKALGVRAGQPVEILLLNTNVDITTFVAGPTAIQQATPLLAEMARHIAGNQELLRRVEAFFALPAANAPPDANLVGSSTEKTLTEADSSSAKASFRCSLLPLLAFMLGSAIAVDRSWLPTAI